MMGWASGSRLFSSVIEAVKQTRLNETEREHLYEKLIDAFADADWDTMDECLGEDSAYDKAYRAWSKAHGFDEDD